MISYKPLWETMQAQGITTYALDSVGMAERAVHMIRHKIRYPYSSGLVSVGGSLIKRTSA